MKHIFILKKDKKHYRFVSKVQDIILNIDATVLYSSSIKESRQIIENIQEPSRLYIGGGDGTINALLPVLINTNHEIVILPLGTGNDLNRSLSFTKDPVKILKASLFCEAKRVDVMKINDTYAINTICFGLDSTIANHVHDKLSIPLPSSLGYIIGILRYILKYKGYDIKVTSKDEVLYEGKITIFAITNGIYYGGGFPVMPQAKLDDGKINVRIADYLPLKKVPFLFLLLLFKKLDGQKEIHDHIVEELDVLSSNPANLDGEMYQSEHYHIHIINKAISLVFTNNG